MLRHQRIVHGDPDVTGDVVVEGTYHIGMQDQAFLGLEAALAIPDDDGRGVELHVATQWMHEDRRQIAACLGLDEEQVRLVLGGVGGAFGAREDISLQVHTCLLALRLGRPVRMHYSRAESFLGHVHRHPATIWMRHHATGDGEIVKIEARFVLDGGAYASTSSAVLLNAITHTQGPYRCPNAVVDGYAARTNHLPCGAMRGFGVVQACFAHESQMDRLAAACGLDPVEIRLRNAMSTGDSLITGQVVESVAPVARCIRETAALPLPCRRPATPSAFDPMRLPGGAGLTADVGDVWRGVGWGVSMKNLMYSEGFDDYSTARCRLQVVDGAPQVIAEVRHRRGRPGIRHDRRADRPHDPRRRRRRHRPGRHADRVVRFDVGVAADVDERGSGRLRVPGRARGAVRTGRRRPTASTRCASPSTATTSSTRRARCASPSPRRSAMPCFERTVEYHHRPTEELDENGQGNCHTAFAFTAHRAVVDVDPELGLVRVVQVATAQDVGRALNPLSVLGQIEGGISQGLGLAVMEEIVQVDGTIRNASFTDYLLPTMLDMPPVVATLVEEPDPQAPLGAKGVGEPPCISVTPAIVAAIRDALRQADGNSDRADRITRVPVRPQDIALPIGEPPQRFAVARTAHQCCCEASSEAISERACLPSARLTPHDVARPDRACGLAAPCDHPPAGRPNWASTTAGLPRRFEPAGSPSLSLGVLVLADGLPTWHQRLMVVIARRRKPRRRVAPLGGPTPRPRRLRNVPERHHRGDRATGLPARSGRRCGDAPRAAARDRAISSVIDGIPCTTLNRTLCDLGSVVPQQVWSVAPLTSARRRGIDLAALYDDARLHRPHQSGTGVLHRACCAALPGKATCRQRGSRSCSPFVSNDPSLPPMVMQQPIVDCSAEGSSPGPTSAFPSVRLGLEAHSRQFHFGPDAEPLDEDRDLAAARCGWELLYLGWYATKKPATGAGHRQGRRRSNAEPHDW